MFRKILIKLNKLPYKQTKNSEGVIYNYYKNGKVKLTICEKSKCSKCFCNV